MSHLLRRRAPVGNTFARVVISPDSNSNNAISSVSSLRDIVVYRIYERGFSVSHCCSCHIFPYLFRYKDVGKMDKKDVEHFKLPQLSRKNSNSTETISNTSLCVQPRADTERSPLGNPCSCCTKLHSVANSLSASLDWFVYLSGWLKFTINLTCVHAWEALANARRCLRLQVFLKCKNTARIVQFSSTIRRDSIFG